jgi:magnesium-transporting ATPase (P-type)
MTTMTILLVIAMIATILMLIARCGWLDCGLGVAGVAAGVCAVILCCVVCWALCDVFEGLREGRHVMPVAAGVVLLPFTRQLEKAIYPVWSCS